VGTQGQLDAKLKEVDINRVCGHKKEASSCCISIYAWYSCITSLKVLGVPITMVCRPPILSVESSLTARRLSNALSALRTHAISDSALQIIFRSVVVAKLLYACSAWCTGRGLTNVTDQQQVNTFFRHSIHCTYCPSDLPPFEELCQAADQQLFSNILTNSGHLLHRFLPLSTTASQNYNLRIRQAHSRQLTLHSGHLTDSNFFTRVLYANIC